MIGQQWIMRDILPHICWFWLLLSWSCCRRVLQGMYCPVSFSFKPSGCLHFLLVCSSSFDMFWLVGQYEADLGSDAKSCSFLLWLVITVVSDTVSLWLVDVVA